MQSVGLRRSVEHGGEIAFLHPVGMHPSRDTPLNEQCVCVSPAVGGAGTAGVDVSQ
jgi:hypothetical protein